MKHGDDMITMMIIKANMDAIRTFGKEFELCPDCYYLTLIANLAYALIENETLSEDEFMTEVQNMVASFREDGLTDERVLH